MPKDLSAKYYQNNKKGYKKNLVKNIEVFLKIFKAKYQDVLKNQF